MSALTIEVRSRVAGLQVDDLTLQPVILELIEERITVRELIRRTVEEQVRDLVARRKLDSLQVQEALQRQYHYLTDDEVTSQAKHGAVRFPSSRPVAIPQIDPQVEVEKALAAFERGSYLVMIDGAPLARLDEQITFAPATKVTFLRIMPLAGG